MSETARRHIVIAYDGSEHARAASEQAGALLRPWHALVACVWAPIELAAPTPNIAAPAGAGVARGAGFAAEARAAQTDDGAPRRSVAADREGILHHAHRPVLVVCGD